MLAAGLPPALQAAAQASEGPASAPAGVPVITTTVQRGPLPVLNSDGSQGGSAPFYAQAPGGSAPSQSSSQLLADVQAQRAAAASSTPADTLAGPDRITTPSSGSGASGLSQLQAQQQAGAWPYLDALTPVGGGDVGVTLLADPAAPQLGSQGALSAQALAAADDQSLDDQLATVVAPGGTLQGPQRVPVVVQATGTISQAAAAGAQMEEYGAVDRVNQVLAPHLEDTSWPGGLPAHHHQALIYPVDYLDQALMERYQAATGIGIPDQEGNPVPGDGLNPVQPVPQGCQAGHPFYDLDGDGSLDRWYSDDPFQGGYQKLTGAWSEEPGGARQLGDFSSHPAYNVCVLGTKRPSQAENGTWVTRQDLLLTIGHNFKPFDHASFTITGYKTYYDGGLITPLDPLDAGDPTLYQFALRNCASFAAQGSPEADGADPAQLVPSVSTVSSTVSLDLLGTGTPQRYLQTSTASFYDGLAASITTPPWVWAWSQAGYQLPAGISDHPGSPAVVTTSWQDASGAVVQRLQVSRPQYLDPQGAASGPFDPSLIPVQAAPPPPVAAVGDTYMWNYPAGVSTAEGGTQVADPTQWRFPWNLAWNDDPHSRNMSAQAFALNSADPGAFPDLAGQTPLITHAALVAAATDGAPPTLQWLLRETTSTAPATGQSFLDYCNGQVLYTAPGWAPPSPWLSPGRAMYHVQHWDAQCDMWGASRAPGNCCQPTGMRVFDVLAGFATYLFRGVQYTPTTPAQQLALLRRMWNYEMTGAEAPAPGMTTLPSLCIPQRLCNGDVSSPPLCTACLPPTSGPALTADAGAAGSGGNLGGSVVLDLADPTAPRLRAASDRRAQLIGQQVFLFSAARGREWELQMARRMPSSVRLYCVEYDDRSLVKAVLGPHGADVWFPQVHTSTVQDALGGVHPLESSDETAVLTELAQTWLDGVQPVLSLRHGQMFLGADSQLHSATPSNDPGLTTGSAASIDPGAAATAGGTARTLPEGIPAGLADFAYVLRSTPQDPQQWRPDPGQSMVAGVTVEFRHPMLLLYHDAASAIYIHYGRNADPDAVFGHWNDCLPAGMGPVASDEVARRGRFDAWATTAQLQQLWCALNPAAAAQLPYARLALPPGPPAPGPEPSQPSVPDSPGPAPQQPVLVLPDFVDVGATPTATTYTAPPVPQLLQGYDDSWAPWAGDASYDGLQPQQQLDRFLSGVAAFDTSTWGWLRVTLAGQEGTGSPLLPPTLWLMGGGTEGYPIGGPNQNCSALLYGTLPADITADWTSCDNSMAFYQLESGQWVDGADWTQDGPLALPAGDYCAVASNDAFGSGHMTAVVQLPAEQSLVDVMESYAQFAHPMTLAWYQGWQVAPTVAWFQAITTSRAQALSAFQQEWSQAQAQADAYQASLAAYDQAVEAAAAWQAQDAAWQAATSAFQAWSTAHAQLLAQQAAGLDAAQAEATWVAQVLAQTVQQAVSWSGDPLCTVSTLEGITALQPQLPIWQAYAWFIDPANGVGQALPVLAGPAAPATTPASGGSTP